MGVDLPVATHQGWGGPGDKLDSHPSWALGVPGCPRLPASSSDGSVGSRPEPCSKPGEIGRAHV